MSKDLKILVPLLYGSEPKLVKTILDCHKQKELFDKIEEIDGIYLFRPNEFVYCFSPTRFISDEDQDEYESKEYYKLTEDQIGDKLTWVTSGDLVQVFSQIDLQRPNRSILAYLNELPADHLVCLYWC